MLCLWILLWEESHKEYNLLESMNNVLLRTYFDDKKIGFKVLKERKDHRKKMTWQRRLSSVTFHKFLEGQCVTLPFTKISF